MCFFYSLVTLICFLGPQTGAKLSFFQAFATLVKKLLRSWQFRESLNLYIDDSEKRNFSFCRLLEAWDKCIENDYFVTNTYVSSDWLICEIFSVLQMLITLFRYCFESSWLENHFTKCCTFGNTKLEVSPITLIMRKVWPKMTCFLYKNYVYQQSCHQNSNFATNNQYLTQ